jgi:predicted TIM-barrel fold metal-dependent hydrolase
MDKIEGDVLISADSHVIEDPDLWQTRLDARFADRAPAFPPRHVGGAFQALAGGWDPVARVEEMTVDGVVKEILYPSLALNLFGITDPDLQAACFAVYNDWLVEFCSVAPDRLFGVAAISTYDPGAAAAELARVRAAGCVGALVWEVPPPELSFATEHYDPFWEAAEDLGVPISLHILTGVPYVASPTPLSNRRVLRDSARHANKLVLEASNAVGDLVSSGVFERFPGLQVVLVESEASWIPFHLSRWDNYASRSHTDSPLTMAPSAYFARNVSATFFNDPTLAAILPAWGVDRCMWSNDFPHANSTWPNSRAVIDRDLGGLSAADRRRLTIDNVTALYGLGAVPA